LRLNLGPQKNGLPWNRMVGMIMRIKGSQKLLPIFLTLLFSGNGTSWRRGTAPIRKISVISS
jgi:hypothetical protein